MNDTRRLLAYAAPHRGALALGAALLMAESGAALAVPWAGGLFAAAVLGESDVATAFQPVLLALLMLFALQALLRFASNYVLDATADRIVADLRVRLYDHLQSLPIAFFHRRRLGDALALLTTDVHEISGYLGGTLVGLVPLAFTAAGAAVLMLRIDAGLACLALVATPAFFLILKFAGRRLRPLSVQLQDEEARALSLVQENLGLLPVIKSFTREPRESGRYREQVGRILSLSEQQRRIHAGLGPLLQFIAAAGAVAVLALAGGDMQGGRLSAAGLVSFLLYAQLLARPMAGLADVYGRTQRVRGALARLGAVMAEPGEETGRPGRTLVATKGEIEFQGVSFAYDAGSPALAAVDLAIRGGETIAIVGRNGAGKSTIGHLLARLHEPSAGRILVDGIDIRTVSLVSLRSQIGVVPQNVMLFHASVRDNIAYARPDTDLAAIEAAAKAARAHDFILKLAQGYDTVIGDRGVRLSGGQQQRIALARALLKDPRILILDEATAMFDPQGEAEFLETCRDSLRRRTVIFITHRPATLAVADRIIHLENGRIVSGAE